VMGTRGVETVVVLPAEQPHGFESTSLFCVLPLQLVPHGGCDPSGLMERGGFFFSGPIERGALSGPLDIGAVDPGRKGN
jgi:hypothetical protein